MFSDLKPYQEYEDTGVPWIGAIPTAWRAVRSKTLMRLRVELVGEASKEYQLLSLTKRGVVRRNVEKLKGKVPASFNSYQIVRNDDLVFCLFDIDETPRTVGLVTEKGMITGAYSRFETKNSLLAQYLVYFFESVDEAKGLRPLYSGLRKVIKTPTFLDAKVPLPPPFEQAAIVKYLGHANARIDRAIAAKHRLITLLEEQKQAIINQAVTRGLDPTVPFKDSRIPWLGQMPMHWNMVPARHLFRTARRRDRNGTETKLSVTQKQGLIPTGVMVEHSTQASNYDQFQVCEAGDLVLNKYKAHLGVFWAARSRGLITPNYTVFAPVETLVTEYFEVLFHTQQYRDAFGAIVYGVSEGMSPLYTKDFNALPVLLPPLDEQAEIAEFAASLDGEQSDPRSRLKAEILLLREFRTRLTADVVTGRLDIRAAASRLPELDPADLVSDVREQDEDDIDAELAGSLEAVDA